jgi:hypothetical protein
LAALPNLGETVFGNGAVENAVRQELGGALGIADTESVIPSGWSSSPHRTTSSSQ